MFALMYRNKLIGKINLSSISKKFALDISPKLFYIFFYRNDCGVFVIKYMEHWNKAVLTHAIDPVCYISKVLNLYALILG